MPTSHSFLFLAPPLLCSPGSRQATLAMCTRIGGNADKEGRMNVNELADVCTVLAARAGAAIREVHADSRPLQAILKDPSDPRSAVTGADGAAQRVILAALRKLHPAIRIVAEEEEDDIPVPDDVSLNLTSTVEHVPELRDVPMSDVCVFIDGLDGTREFVEGRLSAVQSLIGISVRGLPVAGAIAIPFCSDTPVVRGTVGAGISGMEEVQRDDAGVVLAISVVGREPVVDAVCKVVNAETTIEIGGAGNKIMQVIGGAADIAVLNLITSLWDTAATEAVLVANGGMVTDLFGNRITYSSESRIGNCFGVLATGKYFQQRDAKGRSHAMLCKEIRASMIADSLLQSVGLCASMPAEPQATDIARNLDGDILTVKFLSSVVTASVVSYEAPERTSVRYLMSNACRLILRGDVSVPKSLFLKRIVMAELEHVRLKARTAPAKLARDVKSYQVEAGFLASCACANFVQNGARIARPYFVEQRPAKDAQSPLESKFLLLLEDFAPDAGWEQKGLLGKTETLACLSALAEMHAFFSDFRNESSYKELSDAVWDQATYWLPKRQAPDSFKRLPDCWSRQLASFSDLFREAGISDEPGVALKDLGVVLARHAEDVANTVHSVGLDTSHRLRTLIHGDAKAANFFFRRKTISDLSQNVHDKIWDIGMIDFQWCGWGHPMVDVAYLVASSASADILSYDGLAEKDLVQYYQNALCEQLVRFGKLDDLESAKTMVNVDDLMRFYEDAFLDLSRLVVSYHWDRINACPEVLKSRENNLGSNSYNKNTDSAIWLITRTLKLLSARAARMNANVGKV